MFKNEKTNNLFPEKVRQYALLCLQTELAYDGRDTVSLNIP